MNLGQLISLATAAREGYDESTEVKMVDSSGIVLPIERFLIGARIPDPALLVLLVSPPEERTKEEPVKEVLAVRKVSPEMNKYIPEKWITVPYSEKESPYFLGEEDE